MDTKDTDTTTPLDRRIRELERESKSRNDDARREIAKLKAAVLRLEITAEHGTAHGIDSELRFVLAHAESLRETDRRRCQSLACLDEFTSLREQLDGAKPDDQLPLSETSNRKD